ncbi:acyl carrier protein 1, mitochondrial-like [Asparagus officinalis]|nr:acyl carrier protein 1, mitochondrial-like [Asparagus officinalis]
MCNYPHSVNLCKNPNVHGCFGNLLPFLHNFASHPRSAATSPSGEQQIKRPQSDNQSSCHIRVQFQTLNLKNSRQIPLLRSFSSHDDHLTKDEVIDRVLDVVKSFPKVDPSKVTPEVHFQKDLGLDSLDNVEIVMALEEEFKLEIPDKEADKIDSTALAIEYIANHPMAG